MYFRPRLSFNSVDFCIGFAKSWKISSKNCHGIRKSTSSLPQLYQPKHLETRKFRKLYQVRPWENNIPYKHTATLFCNCVTMVVTGISRPAFMYYYRQINPWYTPNTPTSFTHYPKLNKWEKEDCNSIDPYASNQRYMQFNNIVGFNKKFYALSLQGTLVVIEWVHPRIIITDVSSSRAVPSVLSRHFREYLTVSNGEILLIFSISEKFLGVVDNVEIYRLRLEKLTWERMDRLGDRAVFIGVNVCLIISARELGCRGNCVYFANRGVKNWSVYDIARGNISCGLGWRDFSDELFKNIKAVLT